MKVEIVTKVISKEEMINEFTFVVNYFREKGYQQFDVLFGTFWGVQYYKDNWDYEEFNHIKLFEKIKELEELKFGFLGEDDLHLKINDLDIKLLFCHESDIHIRLDDSSVYKEYYFKRWSGLNYSPVEWEIDETGKYLTKITRG